ncbi:hypothetical protein GGF50DRAFT_119385 [Schizophyllum commune]
MVNVNRAIDTIKRAIDADEAHRYEDACALYDEGIRYFMAAMKDGHPERSRVLIREELVLYIRRVVTIRMHLQEQAEAPHRLQAEAPHKPQAEAPHKPQAEAAHRLQANRLLPADYHPRWLPLTRQRWLPLIRQQWAPLAAHIGHALAAHIGHALAAHIGHATYAAMTLIVFSQRAVAAEAWACAWRVAVALEGG